MKLTKGSYGLALLLAGGIGFLLVRGLQRPPKPIVLEAVAVASTLRPKPKTAGHKQGAQAARSARPMEVEAPPTQQVAPRYHPRPPEEWQGMLIDLTMIPVCEPSWFCGNAQVCRDHKCLPCREDGECEGDELCVLDHCVKRELVSCRSVKDCAEGEMCILSGYSSDARGNGDMRAYCNGPDTVQPPEPEETEESPPPKRPWVPPPGDELQRQLREELPPPPIRTDNAEVEDE